MSGLRLVLVSQKYWPLAGCVESAFAQLALAFQCRGIATTVLTAQLEKSWPAEIVHQDIRVVRLPNWDKSGWGTLRYIGAMSRWLRRHVDQYDLAYVAGLAHDAYAAIGALGMSARPVVLQVAAGGSTGDCHWQESARFGRRIRRRCQSADAFVAQTNSIADELSAAGFRHEKIQTIARGVATPPTRDAARRAQARKAMTKAHDILSVAEDTPLAVYIGPFHKSMGLMELVESWRSIAARCPAAKLWLLGDGPDGLAIWERVNELGLTYQIVFPGEFDDVTDVLQAADLFVHPATEDGAATAMLDAMAAGVPVVAVDSPDVRERLGDGQRGLITNSAPRALAESILGVFQNPSQLAKHAFVARRHVEEQFSLDKMVDEHLDLFERLVAEKSRG